MSVDPFAQFDAAYGLGALDPDDLAAFEAHLRTCAGCRARVDELRPTVRLLAAARSADTSQPGGPPDPGQRDPELPPVPDTLLPRLLRQAGRERARRRLVTRGIAGLAAACLVALVVVLWPLSSAHRPAPRALVAVRTTPVEATARLVDEPWGTEIDVHCSYERYAAARYAEYALRVVDRDRKTHDLGTWALQPARPITFVGGTAVRRERIARVEITLPDGTPILQLAL